MYCEDCETTYYLQSPKEHRLVCTAYTCVICEQDFEYTVPLNVDGDRVCIECRGSGDEAELAYEGDEDMEGGD